MLYYIQFSIPASYFNYNKLDIKIWIFYLRKSNIYQLSLNLVYLVCIRFSKWLRSKFEIIENDFQSSEKKIYFFNDIYFFKNGQENSNIFF